MSKFEYIGDEWPETPKAWCVAIGVFILMMVLGFIGLIMSIFLFSLGILKEIWNFLRTWPSIAAFCVIEGFRPGDKEV